ncbi:MAG TPA: TolC family protein [Nitrospiria bacterium]|nr:TolC family protein [Nitrospiria bacterium]
MKAKEIQIFNFWFLIFIFCLAINHISINDAWSEEYDINDIYQLILKNNQKIMIADEDIKQAHLGKDKAMSDILPSLTADGDYTRRPDALSSPSGALVRSESERSLQLTIKQPLYSGGKAKAGIRRAKDEIERTRYDHSIIIEDLFLDAANLYYEALKARRNVGIEEAEVKRLEEHRRSAETRLRVGEVTRTILLRAEAELSGAKADLIRVKNQLRQAKEDISLLAGIRGDFDIKEPKPLEAPIGTDDELIALAYQERRDLAREVISQKIAGEDILIARGGFFPQLSLEASYINRDQDPEGTFSISNERFAILKLTFPLFSGGSDLANLRGARSKLRQADLELLLLRDEIGVDVRKAYLDLGAISPLIDNLKDEVAFARENYTMVSRQFDFGLATNIDVLDANTTLLQAERELSNASYDRDIAVLRLKKVIGVFPSGE